MAKVVVSIVLSGITLTSLVLLAYYKSTPVGYNQKLSDYNEIYFPCRNKECNRVQTKPNQAINTRPNFIILFADDIGWGDLGANWVPENSTTDSPYLDKLANGGIRFTDFHAAASCCTPSRASLLTSRLGVRNGVFKNFSKKSQGGLPLNETTFAETLKTAGYRTAMIGKWHLGVGINKEYHPNKRGFEYYYGLPYSQDMGCVDDPTGLNLPMCDPCPTSNLTHYLFNDGENTVGQELKRKENGILTKCEMNLAIPLYENTTIIEQPTDIGTLAARYAEKASNFILNSQENDQSPFLLYVAFAHTHVPLAYNNRFGNKSNNGVFGDTVRELDATVEAIYSAVEEAGIENNTLLWFTGDNGPWRVKCELGGKQGPFLGLWQSEKGGGGSSAKQTTWEAGHREPALAYWPGHIRPGQVSDSLLTTMDIFPTMAAIAGVPMPPNRRFDGIDISPVLFNSTQIYDRVLFHPNSGAAGDKGALDTVRVAQYKAMYETGGSPDCGGTEGPSTRHDPPLIFNLSQDPAESDALDQTSVEYQNALKMVQGAMADFQTDLTSDNITVADYSQDKAAMPCCDPDNVVCRCQVKSPSGNYKNKLGNAI